MTERKSTQAESQSLKFPVRVVCPVCKQSVKVIGKEIHCISCSRTFFFTDDYPDLIIGGRFDDPTEQAKMIYEEDANRDTTRNYWLPTFQNLFGSKTSSPKVLSLGCGTGADVDILCDEGFNCMGIDCGNRTWAWPRREHKDRFLLANGFNLPFENETFDGVYCGCVFPHVGVVGDSNKVKPDYYKDRLQLAKEMTRVLKTGGKIVVASPNRLFPLDLFHGREEGILTPQLNCPANPFLLSVGDYRKLFLEAGCDSARPLAVQGYWGFIRSKKSLKGLVLGFPVRFIFQLVSYDLFKFLRSSPISPWIIVLAEKS